MSADQNRVSPESPTTCTASGQVMHWDGRQWTHPSGEGCELRTHLSGDTVTAPDLVEVVAKALDDSWDDATEYGTPEDMARAVLDALAKAGKVEWATQGKNMRWTFDTKKEADKETARFPDERTTVSRLTLPWTAVEP